MTGKEHYDAAEALLKSVQNPGLSDETSEFYPDNEGGALAIAAAQVHATLALVANTGAVALRRRGLR